MPDAIAVAAQDPDKENSPITIPAEEESTIALNIATHGCFWNDKAFKDGDRICNGGLVYECSFGKWAKTKHSC